jgi:hypothetical protein
VATDLHSSGLGGMMDDDVMLGDLPRLGVKSVAMVPGSPFRGGGLMEDSAVTTAAAAVQEARRRMDSVRGVAQQKAPTTLYCHNPPSCQVFFFRRSGVRSRREGVHTSRHLPLLYVFPGWQEEEGGRRQDNPRLAPLSLSGVA